MGKRISKNEIEELSKKIDEQFKQFLKEGKYKEVLIAMGNLGKYSLNNQIYILAQKIDARSVYGFRKWNSLGRTIKKGEKALRIFRPIIAKSKDEEEKDKHRLRGFQVGYVFDVSQTEGKEPNVFKFDEKKVIENKEEIIHSLEKVAEENGYRMVHVNEGELGEDCYGLCNHSTHMIKIRNNLCDVQEISTSIHELGHALAHSGMRKDFEGLTAKEKREIKEIEAESIACIVSTYLGLDTQNFNFSYISGWAEGDISKFRKNMDIISECARKIISKLEEL